ncbi:malate dehydrogenase (NAD) [Verrucomicrobium sp. GAS474]|uniref:malate dehydrogenase n=1 Tax=Verrucomicrobium sp. GAS474 TaxID=1882831 RepID=UPI00087B3CFF|nr:malate dehydrogenase [Verrucomicrobium sp. GAS474]SDU00633.1 malate dehydrogenase (NAD) [Verrucomicrobium sp. GAS474]
MRKPKVTVVGAGFVGATAAQRLVEKNLATVVLHDIVPGMPQGKALDLMQSACIEGYESTVTGTNDPADYAGSDIVIVTSGLARQPGMSRDDLLLKNAEIVGSVAENIRKYAPDAIVIVVSNPLDVMTALVAAKTGFPKERVMGMAGVLDSARFRAFIAMELGVAHQDVDAMVLGGHGDDMVPLSRYTTVSGIGIEALLPPEKIAALAERTRNGGAEIVKLLQKGSAYYAPSAAAVAMAQAILRDEKRLLPASAWCTGQYGIENHYVGVPIVLGKEGVEKIVTLDLTAEELKALHASVGRIAESVAKLGL